jgi:hypothetical protein
MLIPSPTVVGGVELKDATCEKVSATSVLDSEERAREGDKVAMLERAVRRL